ncbi:electron transfer flavoprotein-ubiquinone oxidoreductase [Chelatococcus composti]|jgi:Dehydrogenases (flavoproteins)|uniref:Electron transfer flavoprotein-ubiquinone oxidoreductase n=1 Tax=Chelatococcus composti TaxID=1743235 RepID=A0A841KC64_9HYPH|nr:electron transfer flavoprotein-ubiquinone oxidoreductase [Chelatococcus composti]MBB6168504.1 electron-transferring-flavoprotein dehydrogenase [Chelatococcus composti]PZN37224.1 MAG: electron transfer flavoprotein-ubiquinone oxidoreductase [Pseudomonadota bacterium]GGG40568.1 electron-transferring-flavoprotein dehydrogenase [Chelatococcus composti]
MDLPERERMDYDVVIVGAGPAGLAAAIRLKQLAAEAGREVSVVVVEKGSEVGAHILSGAVIDPIGLDRLLPDWREDPDRPLKTQVSTDRFLYLGPAGGVRLPNFMMPRLMNNHGNFVGSLGNVARYLAARAEALGVEIYPGFAAAEVLYGDRGEVVGIATGDMGIGRDGKPKADFTRGMELRGKYTLFAEGARGSLSKQLIKRFSLDEGREPQKFGIGLKELWQIPPEKFQPGLVQHTFGWPLDNGTGGGSFLYHFDDNLVSIGFVVHLNYSNPTLSPFDEFQRFKTHPMIRGMLEGGKRIAYGARAITEGGFQSVPKLVFPGGALIGCSAGFVNVPRIKGSHNAILSGMLCAEHVFAALGEGREHDELTGYETGWRRSDIGRDLHKVRNVKPLWSRFGTMVGVALGGIDMWTNELFGFSLFGTLGHGKPDHASLKRIDEVKPIVYPKPDGVVSFDKLSSVFLSNTNHEEDQPVHLKLADPAIPIERNLPLYGEPARLYCPAGVYEVVYDDPQARTNPRFVINAQNCVHCKTCDIKDPAQNINWVTPEGGGGPNYPNM